jgi:hypothetical protein
MTISPHSERRLLRRETDISAIPSTLLHQIHDYWLKKRGAATMPSWSDIDPGDMAHLLPHLMVVGVEHEPLRILYRLVGTLVAEFRGDPTGHYLDAIPWTSPETKASVQGSYAIAIATRAPTFVETLVPTKVGGTRRTFGGIWPLAPGPDSPVDRCLAAEDYGDLRAIDLAQ